MAGSLPDSRANTPFHEKPAGRSAPGRSILIAIVYGYAGPVSEQEESYPSLFASGTGCAIVAQRSSYLNSLKVGLSWLWQVRQNF
jgi:hypothetical protein